MEKKRKIFIIVLILLIALAIFAFANPRTDEEDTKNPIGNTSYKEETGCKVLVTIRADEKIKNISGWVKVNDKTFTKYYFDNIKEYVTITDLSGNTSNIKIEIKDLVCVGEPKEPIEPITPVTPVVPDTAKPVEKPVTPPIIKLPTNTIPTITLNGAASITAEKGSYVELGATATDFEDENITSNIVITYKKVIGITEINVLNLNNVGPGTYKVTYTVTDKDNNTVNATRDIVIIDTTAPTIISYTEKNININETKVVLITSEKIEVPVGFTKIDATTYEKIVTDKNETITVPTITDLAGNTSSVNQALLTTTILELTTEKNKEDGQKRFLFGMTLNNDFTNVTNSDVRFSYKYSLNNGAKETAIELFSQFKAVGWYMYFGPIDAPAGKLPKKTLITAGTEFIYNETKMGSTYWKNLATAIDNLDGTSNELEIFPTITIKVDGVSKAFELSPIKRKSLTADITAPTVISYTEKNININETKVVLVTSERIEVPVGFTKINETTYEKTVKDKNETITVPTITDLAGNTSLVNQTILTTTILELTTERSKEDGQKRFLFGMTLNNDFTNITNSDVRFSYKYSLNSGAKETAIELYSQFKAVGWYMYFGPIDAPVGKLPANTIITAGTEFIYNETKMGNTYWKNLATAIDNLEGTSNELEIFPTITIKVDGVSKAFELTSLKRKSIAADTTAPTVISYTEKNININETKVVLVTSERIEVPVGFTKIDATTYEKIVKDKNETVTVPTITDLAGNTSSVNQTILTTTILELTTEKSNEDGQKRFLFGMTLNNDFTNITNSDVRFSYKYSLNNGAKETAIELFSQFKAVGWYMYFGPIDAPAGKLPKKTLITAGTEFIYNETKMGSTYWKNLATAIDNLEGTSDELEIFPTITIKVDGVSKAFELSPIKRKSLTADTTAPTVISYTEKNININETKVVLVTSERIEVPVGFTKIDATTYEKTVTDKNETITVPTITDLTGNTSLVNQTILTTTILELTTEKSKDLSQKNFIFGITLNNDFTNVNNNDVRFSYKYSLNNGAKETAIDLFSQFKAVGWYMYFGPIDAPAGMLPRKTLITAGTEFTYNETKMGNVYWKSISAAIDNLEGTSDELEIFPTITIKVDGVSKAFELTSLKRKSIAADITAPTVISYTEKNININETKVVLVTSERIEVPVGFTKIDATTYEKTVTDKNETVTVPTITDLTGNTSLVNQTILTTTILELTTEKSKDLSQKNFIFGITLNNDFTNVNNNDVRFSYKYSLNNGAKETAIDLFSQFKAVGWYMYFGPIDAPAGMLPRKTLITAGTEFTYNETKMGNVYWKSISAAIDNLEGTSDELEIFPTITIKVDGVSKAFELTSLKRKSTY